MKGPVPTLCSALALPAGEGVPDWLHLLPAGAIRTQDGRGPYHVADAAQLMRASIAGGKLPIDECHVTDLGARAGSAAPARGWIVDLQHRDDGIWGKVEWTPKGRALMEDREYRGLSPVIVHKKDGAITGLLRASLTNVPNFVGLTALHHQEKTMDFRAWLIEALSLAADADDDAIVAAMNKRLGDSAETALQSALRPIADAIGTEATTDAVLAGVQQLKNEDGRDATITALQSELVDTTNKLNTLIETSTRRDAAAFVDAAIAAGRVGVKPQRDRYIALHMADAANAQALIGSLPIVKDGATLEGQPAETGQDGLDTNDRQIISLMGLDPQAYADTLGERGEKIA